VTLYEATRDLHHAAEAHPFGTALASGNIAAQPYADWLCAQWTVHRALDPLIPAPLARADAMEADMRAMLPIKPRPVEAARRFAATITPGLRAVGVGYIFSGAHLRGGAVIRKRLEPKGLPCGHMRFADARAANEALTGMRETIEAAPHARDAFAAIIEVMDEICRRDA
jgi:heme oxygenase